MVFRARRGWMVMVAASAACGDPATALIDARPALADAEPDAPADAPGPRIVTVVELPATPLVAVDVLLVVDDSSGMAAKQAKLADALPALVERLAARPGGLPDLHLGVVTTDLGTAGSASATPAPAFGTIGNGGCAGTGRAGALQTFGVAVTGAFVSDVAAGDGSRVRNYTGDLATVAGSIVRGAGEGGCGFEQPLGAMRAALGPLAANAGFLRADAALAVLVLSDEDDCSVASTAFFDPATTPLGPLGSFRCTRLGVTCAVGGPTPQAMDVVGTKTGCGPQLGLPYLDPVAPLRSFLVGVKGGDARRIAVGALVGAPDPFEVVERTPTGGTPAPALLPSCGVVGGTASALPAVRIDALLREFPLRSHRGSVCADTLDADLTRFADAAVLALGAPCLTELPLDLAPELGLQPDCVVDDITAGGTSTVPACGPVAATPCWRIVADATACPRAPGLALEVMRAAPLEPAAVTRMRCTVP